MGEAGADVVGVDFRVPLDEAARRVGPGRALQGNLDPALLFAPEEVVRAEDPRGPRARAAPRRATSSTSATASCPRPTPTCWPASSTSCTRARVAPTRYGSGAPAARRGGGVRQTSRPVRRQRQPRSGTATTGRARSGRQQRRRRRRAAPRAPARNAPQPPASPSRKLVGRRCVRTRQGDRDRRQVDLVVQPLRAGLQRLEVGLALGELRLDLTTSLEVLGARSSSARTRATRARWVASRLSTSTTCWVTSSLPTVGRSRGRAGQRVEGAGQPLGRDAHAQRRHRGRWRPRSPARRPPTPPHRGPGSGRPQVGRLQRQRRGAHHVAAEGERPAADGSRGPSTPSERYPRSSSAAATSPTRPTEPVLEAAGVRRPQQPARATSSRASRTATRTASSGHGFLRRSLVPVGRGRSAPRCSPSATIRSRPAPARTLEACPARRPSPSSAAGSPGWPRRAARPAGSARGSRCSRRPRGSAASYGSATSAGSPVDEGADSMLAAGPRRRALAAGRGARRRADQPRERPGRDLDARPAAPAARRHRHGRPRRPRGARRAASVLAARGLARVATRPRAARAPAGGRRRVGELVARRLGREVVERLVDPLLGGVYAGRADRLSLHATLPQLVRRGRRAAQPAARGPAARATATPSTGPVFARPARRARPAAGGGRRGVAARDVRLGTTVRGLARTPDRLAARARLRRRPGARSTSTPSSSPYLPPRRPGCSATSPRRRRRAGRPRLRQRRRSSPSCSTGRRRAPAAATSCRRSRAAPPRPSRSPAASGRLPGRPRGRPAPASAGTARRPTCSARTPSWSRSSSPSSPRRSGRCRGWPTAGSSGGAAACRSTPSATSTWSPASAPRSPGTPGLAVAGAAYDGVGVPAVAGAAREAAQRVLAGHGQNGGMTETRPGPARRASSTTSCSTRCTSVFTGRDAAAGRVAPGPRRRGAGLPRRRAGEGRLHPRHLRRRRLQGRRRPDGLVDLPRPRRPAGHLQPVPPDRARAPPRTGLVRRRRCTGRRSSTATTSRRTSAARTRRSTSASTRSSARSSGTCCPTTSAAACSPSTGSWAREYEDVRANTVAAFGLGDYEWLLAFEADELHRIVDCIRHLRALPRPAAHQARDAVLHRRPQADRGDRRRRCRSRAPNADGPAHRSCRGTGRVGARRTRRSPHRTG